jgi:hypothetical protein
MFVGGGGEDFGNHGKIRAPHYGILFEPHKRHSPKQNPIIF